LYTKNLLTIRKYKNVASDSRHHSKIWPIVEDVPELCHCILNQLTFLQNVIYLGLSTITIFIQFIAAVIQYLILYH
jgi:hypothetical protein